MERLILQFLTSLSNSPGWDNTISLVNEHHQTLAHLAVLFRYTTLLEKVMQWGIDVDVQDVNGFTALHCAYLCRDLDSVRILQSYGADEDIEDVLSRRPLDMYIKNTNGPGTDSPSTDRTPSSGEVPSAGEEDWEMVSMTSSQPASYVDHETTTGLPASGHQQLQAHESTTSFRILPASISMSSPMCDNVTDDGGGIGGANELKLTNSPISLEHSQSSAHVPDILPASLQYARNHQQEPEEVEKTFKEPNWTRNRDVQSMSSQQTDSKSRRNSQIADNGRDRPGEYVLVYKWLERSHIADYIIISIGLPTSGSWPIPREELEHLERIFYTSPWLLDNVPEPLIGDLDCPTQHGIRGRSCYTAFVLINDDDTFACQFESCYGFRIESLEGAIRHQRCHHFNHAPFKCIPASGALW